MASIYARGNRLWLKIKNGRDPGTGKATYDGQPTPFCVGDEAKAPSYAVKLEQFGKAENGEDAAPALTIASYAKKWIAAREAQKLASVTDDAARLRLHVVPVLGHVQLTELRPRHVRELILAMKSPSKPRAPRTIRHVYAVLRTIVNDARAEELIDQDPCILKRGVLPRKIDKFADGVTPPSRDRWRDGTFANNGTGLSGPITPSRHQTGDIEEGMGVGGVR